MMLVEIAAYAFKGLLESYTPPSSLLVFVPALSMVTKPDTENSTGAAVESQPLKLQLKIQESPLSLTTVAYNTSGQDNVIFTVLFSVIIHSII